MEVLRAVFDTGEAHRGLSECQIRKGQDASALRYFEWTAISFKSSSVNCHGASLCLCPLTAIFNPASVSGFPLLWAIATCNWNEKRVGLSSLCLCLSLSLSLSLSPSVCLSVCLLFLSLNARCQCCCFVTFAILVDSLR